MNLRDFFTVTTWWGKICGALFGYLSAGPIGALFGILVGNFFDRGLVSYYTNPHLHYFSEKRKEVQKVYFETTFSVMGHLAKADGRVSEQDIKIAQFLMDEMRLDSQQKILAKRLYNEGKKPGFELEKTLFDFKKACKDNRELLMLFVEIQYRSAQVDGLSANQIKLLNIIFSILGFAPLNEQSRFYDDFGYTSHTQQQYQQQQKRQEEYQRNYSSSSQKKQDYYQYQAPTNNLAHAYALLEVNPNVSKQDLKRAYRRLLSRNHPDKLIAKGLPEEMIKIANDKTQKIMKAYELICQNKGW